MQHHDLSLLFSLGLVGCSLDVGDALTDTFTSTHGMSAGEGMGGDGTEDTGEMSEDDDEGNGNGDDGNNDDGGAGPMTGATSAPMTGGGEDDGAADSTGWPWPETEGGGETYGGGTYAEPCASWDMHAQECGFGTGAGAACQYDLDYGSYLGEACPSALEDYYACLGSTDCAELENADPNTVCGADQVLMVCGGG